MKELSSINRLIATAGLVSAGVLAYEICLMRMLLVSSWHHFAFLVISVGLLGFGASGTLLAVFRDPLKRAAPQAMFGFALATALSMVVSTQLAQHVPIEARVVPALFWRQAGMWLIYWTLLFVPFLFGACAIGLALMLAKRRVALVYASNLVGSGIGALAATALIAIQPTAWLAVTTAGITLLGAACVTKRPALPAICVVAIAAWLWLDPPTIRIDPFKYGAHVQRLEQQGSATRLAARHSRRGMIEAYAGDVFHEMPFLTTGRTPPPLHALLIDKHWAGSVLAIDTSDDAAVVEQSLMAAPYALVPNEPRVLLLGERGGANIWLAQRMGAAAIDVVQPHGALFELLRGPLLDRGGAVLNLPNVETNAREPRHFVEQTSRSYDLIQLVTLEGSAAGSGGVAGLGQDYLATVEGIGVCMGRLTDDGVLSICRGIQTPPRDNIKLLALIVEALESTGVEHPENHVAIVRDYLAVCTIARRTPWTDDDIARIRQLCEERQLTPVWFPGIRDDELNQPDALLGPADGNADWYHHAAIELFGPKRQRFIDGWRFDIRPPRDNRPFFQDFFKLSSIGAMREAFGDMWLSRVEMAFLFVLVTIAATTIFAAALTILPLAWLVRKQTFRGWLPTAGYFGAIGLAYLTLEITVLSRLTHLIGDPVEAAAVTIAAFLLFSGAGSAAAHRRGKHTTLVFVVIIVLAVLLQVMLGPLAAWASGWPSVGRIILALAVIAPLAFSMGFPMPLALKRLSTSAADLIPWAWGINGFASVIAAPLATAIAMAFGYWQAATLALGCYALAAMLLPTLPGASR